MRSNSIIFNGVQKGEIHEENMFNLETFVAWFNPVSSSLSQF